MDEQEARPYEPPANRFAPYPDPYKDLSGDLLLAERVKLAGTHMNDGSLVDLQAPVVETITRLVAEKAEKDAANAYRLQEIHTLNEQLHNAKKTNTRQANRIRELERMARIWFRSDGKGVTLDTPEEVIERRKAAAIEMEQMRACLRLVCEATSKRLDDMPQYPCGVSEMTDREHEITDVASHAIGCLLFIVRTLEAAGIESEPADGSDEAAARDGHVRHQDGGHDRPRGDGPNVVDPAGHEGGFVRDVLAGRPILLGLDLTGSRAHADTIADEDADGADGTAQGP